jgi:hypothetical protein
LPNNILVGFKVLPGKKVAQVDEYVAFLPGVSNFMKQSGMGNSIHSVRIAFQPNELFRISFLVNNLTNEEYALRPGKMDAPRLFSFQLRVQF